MKDFFFNVNIFFKSKYARTNDYSFKYVCVVCCLKLRFYCLIFPAMSNLNSADFTTPNSHQRCYLSSKIRRILKWWVIISAFGFALELSSIDLLDIHLDLLDTAVPSKYFVYLHNVFKTSPRHVFETSSTHVFQTSSRYVFKRSSRHMFKTSWRRLQCNNFSSSEDVKLLRWRLKMCWRSLHGMFWGRLEGVFKTNKCLLGIHKSSHPEVFLRKGVLKKCCKFAGEYQCRSAISIKLLYNFVEIALWHGCSLVNLLHIFRTPFPKNNYGRLLLYA